MLEKGWVAEELDERTTFYALRHTTVSGTLKVGVLPKVVADHCGTLLAMI